jgi:hypothetical protein
MVVGLNPKNGGWNLPLQTFFQILALGSGEIFIFRV